MDQIERAARENGIDAHIRVVGSDLQMFYITTAMRESQSASEIKTLAGSYASGIAAGHECGDLHVNAHDPRGNQVDEWKVCREWAEQLVDGKLTPTEYLDAVADTSTMH